MSVSANTVVQIISRLTSASRSWLRMEGTWAGAERARTEDTGRVFKAGKLGGAETYDRVLAPNEVSGPGFKLGGAKGERGRMKDVSGRGETIV